MTEPTWTQLAFPLALGLDGLKVCKDCFETKPHASFSRQAGYRDGYRSNCKDCVTLRAKRWCQANPERAAAGKRRHYEVNGDEVRARVRDLALTRRYGITRSQYDEQLVAQGHRCAICGSDEPGSKYRRFAVDHCHRTGRARGLLCNPCNIGMGRFADNADLILAARIYVRAACSANGCLATAHGHGTANRAPCLSNVRYAALLDAQQGVCAVCGSPRPGSTYKRFVIDHCHVTGRVRGLLCAACNWGIGYLRDDPEVMTAAVAYLRTWGTAHETGLRVGNNQRRLP